LIRVAAVFAFNKGEGGFWPQRLLTPIPPAKPSASVLSCKTGIKSEVNERGWPSMRKEFLNDKDPSHESQRKFRGHSTDFF